MNPNIIYGSRLLTNIIHVQGHFITIGRWEKLVNYIPQNTSFEVYKLRHTDGHCFFGIGTSFEVDMQGKLAVQTAWYINPIHISKEFKTWLMVSGYSLNVEHNT